MGTRVVTLCTGSRDPIDMWRHHPDNAGPDAWRDLLAAMEGALTEAEAHGVDLGVEPELANVVATPERARALVDTLRSPCLRSSSIRRTSRASRRRITVARRWSGRSVGLLAGQIVLAHAQDRRADGSVAPAGSGVLDFDHFVSRLRRAGFDGPLVADGLTPEAAPGVAVFLRQVMTSCPRQ